MSGRWAHFRHPAGAQKDDCSLVAARLAATRHLLELGVIELLRRRLARTAQGFSGDGHEVFFFAGTLITLTFSRPGNVKEPSPFLCTDASIAATSVLGSKENLQFAGAAS